MSLSSSYKALRSSRSFSLASRKPLAQPQELAQGLGPSYYDLPGYEPWGIQPHSLSQEDYCLLQEFVAAKIQPEKAYSLQEIQDLLRAAFPVAKPTELLTYELIQLDLLELTPGRSKLFLAGSTPF